jgi:hypothetical protein
MFKAQKDIAKWRRGINNGSEVSFEEASSVVVFVVQSSWGEWKV